MGSLSHLCSFLILAQFVDRQYITWTESAKLCRVDHVVCHHDSDIVIKVHILVHIVKTIVRHVVYHCMVRLLVMSSATAWWDCELCRLPLHDTTIASHVVCHCMVQFSVSVTNTTRLEAFAADPFSAEDLADICWKPPPEDCFFCFIPMPDTSLCYVTSRFAEEPVQLLSNHKCILTSWY